MKDWLNKRRREGSTFLGLGMLLGAAGILVKSPELQQAGEIVAGQSDNLATIETSWPILLGSLLSIFAPTSDIKRK